MTALDRRVRLFAVACATAFVALLVAGAGAARAATASLAADRATVRVGEPVGFDASGSAGAPPLAFSWDFGDSSDAAVASGARVTHAFAAPGTYVVRVDVSDDDWDGGSAETTVVVTDEFGVAVGSGPAEVARSGGVAVGLYYDKRGHRYRDLRLRIARGGVVVPAAALQPPCAFCVLEPAGFGERRSVRLLDLDADGEPEVVVDLWTGGAHCCWDTQVYRWDAAAGLYRHAGRDFGHAPPRIVDADGDGTLEFKAADSRFAYAFTSFSASLLPAQVVRLRDGELRDVTRSFRSVVRADERRAWRLYVRLRGRRGADVRGILAAWMADKSLLGESAGGWRALRVALRRGDLRGAAPDAWPADGRYLRVLRRRLARWGYR